MIVRRVGALSCAKISGAIYALLGSIIGFLFALFSLFGAALGGGPETLGLKRSSVLALCSFFPSSMAGSDSSAVSFRHSSTIG